MDSSDERQLLVVIFDVNPVWWGLKSLQGQSQITKCLDCLLVFINSYLMLRHDNQLAVIASHSTKSVFLYPHPQNKNKHDDSAGVSQSPHPDSRYEHFATVDDSIVADFKALMEEGCDETDIRSDSLIAGSMSMALCYIHRISQKMDRKRLSSRILVVKTADDAASQYMSFMNVIFAAQKEKIVIDACILGQDSGLLQQSCDMTGGLYLKVPSQNVFLQYLLTAFLTEAEMRNHCLAVAQNKKSHQNVDYRAACFCHRSLTDIGFVCSVCLSIFCQFSPICSTCETVFRPPALGLKGRKKRKGQSRSSSPYTEVGIK